ncbi:hypothetical protein B0T24DRAFT_681879 [Lasiosphaeria ovina]|uniref:Uncharacterized protein n=1 Tax=Lasiosphaeria ovina TaxID=92902 RepID=A0AAE0JZS5_9PEZI|nr:hypothetical protein B0T24DRAFT_681879 [Lasiosphaeria ovina]
MSHNNQAPKSMPQLAMQNLVRSPTHPTAPGPASLHTQPAQAYSTLGLIRQPDFMGVTPGSNNRLLVGLGVYSASASASAAWFQPPLVLAVGRGRIEATLPNHGAAAPKAEVFCELVPGSPKKRPAPGDDDGDDDDDDGSESYRRKKVRRREPEPAPEPEPPASAPGGQYMQQWVNEEAVRGVARENEAEAEREARKAANRNLFVGVEQDEGPWRQLVRVVSEEAERLAREEADRMMAPLRKCLKKPSSSLPGGGGTPVGSPAPYQLR